MNLQVSPTDFSGPRAAHHGATFEALIREAQRLAAARPKCHRTNNELGALILLAGMHAKGMAVSLEMAKGCVERMRIALETGEYPEDLLRAWKPIGADCGLTGDGRLGDGRP